MPEWLIVLIFVSVGFIFLILELFTPGFGLAGLIGIVLLALGSITAYTKLNIFWGVVTSLGSIALTIVFFKSFARSKVWKKLKLEASESKSKGFSSSASLEDLMGRKGKTISELRPTGIADIEGKRIDVIAESLFIPRDTEIIVTRVEGNKVTVKTKI